MELFECQNCNSLAEKTDTRYERIQSPDDLTSSTSDLILSELWYCFECNSYFKAYYKFDKIKMLKEGDI